MMKPPTHLVCKTSDKTVRVVGHARDTESAKGETTKLAERGDATYCVYKLVGFAKVGPVRWQDAQ